MHRLNHLAVTIFMMAVLTVTCCLCRADDERPSDTESAIRHILLDSHVLGQPTKTEQVLALGKHPVRLDEMERVLRGYAGATVKPGTTEMMLSSLAIEVLGSFHSSETKVLLAELCNDSHQGIRIPAIRSLVQIDRAAMSEPVRRILDDRKDFDSHDRRMCYEALIDLAGDVDESGDVRERCEDLLQSRVETEEDPGNLVLLDKYLGSASPAYGSSPTRSAILRRIAGSSKQKHREYADRALQGIE